MTEMWIVKRSEINYRLGVIGYVDCVFKNIVLLIFIYDVYILSGIIKHDILRSLN